MVLLPGEFLEMGKVLPVVDVRTPAEFEQGHIPGAHNIPLFTNEERAVVGTLYKREGKEVAFMKGLDYVGPRMRWFVKEARRLAPSREILVHCWRGGMRSGSMAWLFRSAGFTAHTLEGGYKGYRRHIRKKFETDSRWIIIGGYTGSGKTEILKELEKLGNQIVDLEGIARHKGSAFGHIGQKPQPTTEQFENNLAARWNELDFSKTIWMEDESKAIGHVFQPDNFYRKLRTSTLVFVEVPKEARISRLVKEYAGIDKNALAQALAKIVKRLGGQNYQKAVKALEVDDYATVADITLTYYDKAYGYGVSQRDKSKVIILKVDGDNPPETAEKIISLF
jgi:tRNA 2-selenouridine synthase